MPIPILRDMKTPLGVVHVGDRVEVKIPVGDGQFANRDATIKECLIIFCKVAVDGEIHSILYSDITAIRGSV